ncbi:MAG: DegT/DnrJ/EryC1/StrS family aminotransferase [Crocinitomicaceae bacterium]|nr:DegT/DnrJ/EryC1/StrS family aminotransferase [Crocinitomicaceae bacterium]
MKQIQMVDLQTQYQKIKSEVNEEIAKVLDSSFYINGPVVKEFQTNLEQYLNVKHVIPCANGTDALQIAIMALDLKPGDEIITSDFTFAATVEVVKLLQLEAVLVDVDKDTYNISIESIKKAITPKTKVIIPVHIFGQCANMDEILAIAQENNLYVIEDTAQAIGADYKFKDGSTQKAGTMGDIGTTSFFPSKNLGGYGDGGAIFTNNDEYAAIMRSVVNHGMGKRYYYDRVGVNSRLDSLQAAILKVKLGYLNDYIAARQKAASFYDNFFSSIPGVVTPARVDYSTHVFHQYTLVIDGLDQFKLQEFLNEKGIPAMIYYPLPLHIQKAYDAEKYNDGDFPNTNYLCQNVISLPMHTELEEDQLQFICESIKTFLQK